MNQEAESSRTGFRRFSLTIKTMFTLIADKSGCRGTAPSYSELMSRFLDIPAFKVQQGEALHRQITKHIRTLIQAGNLPAGSKLPRMHDLAAHWRTNYFTVHTALTGLVREGLLERKPRLGTFVRQKSKDLRSVGIYYGDEILIKHEREFYRSLHAQLLFLLHKENIATRIFIDSRPKDLQSEALPELGDSINSHAIQGLIVPLVSPSMNLWINNLPVPTSVFSMARSECSRICNDNQEFITISCEALRDQGCKTVGLISPTRPSGPSGGKNETESILNAFLSAIEKFNLKTQKSWIRVPRTTQEQQEKYGYQQFHKLWDLAEKPDGLIVYPENVSHGVALALLEKQVKVPTELKLVLHKNQNVDFLCPLPTNWIITREKDIAEALIQQIQDRFAGLEPRNYIIHSILVKMDLADPMASLRVGMSAGALH
jgi:DNA-binding LacI/PurR family transcriptional regulator